MGETVRGKKEGRTGKGELRKGESKCSNLWSDEKEKTENNYRTIHCLTL